MDLLDLGLVVVFQWRILLLVELSMSWCQPQRHGRAEQGGALVKANDFLLMHPQQAARQKAPGAALVRAGAGFFPDTVVMLLGPRSDLDIF